MAFDLPSAMTYPDVAKEQHLVPRTYMREWSYNDGDLIWIIDRDKIEEGIQSKNVDNINFKVGFHDIKAGDIFMPKEALSDLFGFMKDYTIEYEGNEYTELEDFNRYFYDFDKWTIKDFDGTVATRKVKNEIYRIIKQSRHTFIETEWCYQFEDGWKNFIAELEQKFRCKVFAKPYKMNREELEKLFEYLLVFDFRSLKGNSYVSDIISSMPLEMFDEIEFEKKERVHSFNATGGDELRHALKISTFYKYLKSRTGSMDSMLSAYVDRLGLGVYLTTEEFPFITSDEPSQLIKRVDGKLEHIFMTSPTMMIVVNRCGDGAGHLFTEKIKPKDVKKYNKYLANGSSVVILKSNDKKYEKLFQ